MSYWIVYKNEKTTKKKLIKETQTDINISQGNCIKTLQKRLLHHVPTFLGYSDCLHRLFHMSTGLYFIHNRSSRQCSLHNSRFSSSATNWYLYINQGFGLYFSYLRSNVWSGIGFTFFITTLVFQLYFLINGFWTRVPIQTSTVTWSNRKINAYLSN